MAATAWSAVIPPFFCHFFFFNLSSNFARFSSKSLQGFLISEFPYSENSSRTQGRPILGVAWDFFDPKGKRRL